MKQNRTGLTGETNPDKIFIPQKIRCEKCRAFKRYDYVDSFYYCETCDPVPEL